MDKEKANRIQASFEKVNGIKEEEDYLFCIKMENEKRVLMGRGTDQFLIDMVDKIFNAHEEVANHFIEIVLKRVSVIVEKIAGGIETIDKTKLDS